ncbi:MAG: aldehyde dehydrogenase family protein [Acidimicrobiia bacterium]
MTVEFLVATGDEVEVRAPADETVVGSVRLSTVDDVADAVRRARQALQSWRHASPFDRGRVLARGAARLRERSEELGILHSRESGKVLAQALREVTGAAFLLEENAHIARFSSGYLAPTGALAGGEKDLTIVERVPLGVVVCVIPFNFPVELVIEKAGAALAAGNAVIVKPPPQNPLATIETVSVLVESGLPEGLISVVTGGRDVSAALCSAEGVDAVSLTGSVAAGIAVAQATAHLLRPLHLELGGNGAAIITEDTDLDHVVGETLRGRLLMNGQACAATKRLVVERSVSDELVQRLDTALSQVRVGDPTDPESDLGPLIDASSAARVASQVSHAVDQGGSLAFGDASSDRAWFSPVILSSLPEDADVARDDEIFGPVVSVIPFEGEAQAVRIVNSSQLALTAAVFCTDVGRAMGIAQQLDVGGVVINGTNNYRPPVVPFGGVGLAGAGREGLGYTFDELTRSKFIAIRNIRPAGIPIGGAN